MIQPPISDVDNLNNHTKPEGANSQADGERNIYMGNSNYNERIKGDYIDGNQVNNYYTRVSSIPRPAELPKNNYKSISSGLQPAILILEGEEHKFLLL